MPVTTSVTTDDLRIAAIKELTPPATIMAEHVRTPAATRLVAETRTAIHNILRREDDRLIAVVGPCSIHDPEAALDYAERLAGMRKRYLPSTPGLPCAVIAI